MVIIPNNSKNTLFSKLRRFIHKILTPHHTCRVLSIEKNDENNHVAYIQFVGKNKIFKIKPEDILADNSMTDLFSQRDIRTLTYLGYLGINSPKYKILAKRLSEKDNKILFDIQEIGGAQHAIVKTAEEIALDKKFLTGLTQLDAHMLGFATAMEQANSEHIQKQNLLKTLKQKQRA